MTEANTTPKKILITLLWGINQYEVRAITNTTKYKPGQWLDVDEVEKLCQIPNWEVVIADNDFIKEIFDVGVSKVQPIVL